MFVSFLLLYMVCVYLFLPVCSWNHSVWSRQSRVLGTKQIDEDCILKGHPAQPVLCFAEEHEDADLVNCSNHRFLLPYEGQPSFTPQISCSSCLDLLVGKCPTPGCNSGTWSGPYMKAIRSCSGEILGKHGENNEMDLSIEVSLPGEEKYRSIYYVFWKK